MMGNESDGRKLTDCFDQFALWFCVCLQVCKPSLMQEQTDSVWGGMHQSLLTDT